jgi:hypothetical protein
MVSGGWRGEFVDGRVYVGRIEDVLCKNCFVVDEVKVTLQ